MAKSIKADLQKIRSNLFVFFFCLCSILPNLTYAYLDQVIVEMPKAAKTIYDIRVHSYIRHLYEQGMKIDPMTDGWLASFFDDERQNFIEQYLAQNYVSENGLNIKPTKDEVKQGIQRIHQVFATPDERKKSFAALNINDEDVEIWVFSRIVFDKFLSTSIQDRVVITDQRLEQHYQTWKSTRFLNKSYEEVAVKVREDLSKTLLQEEFQKWVDQEKRRQKMIIKTITKS
jgi:hypothetical protein